MSHTPPLPEGYTLRPPVRQEAAGVAALINTTDAALGGATDETVEDVLAEWDSPGFDLVDGAWVILDPAGQIVGYEECQADHSAGDLRIDGYVHPAHLGRGLGTHLLRQAERRAHHLIDGYPSDVEGKIIAHCYSHDQASVALFTHEGYQVTRHFWRMEIEMVAPPTPPTWPTGISVRTFVLGQDDRATHRAVTEAFMDSWGFAPLTFDEWAPSRIWREDFDPSWWFLAIDEQTGEIAGVALGNLRGEAQEVGWVRALGVRPPYRKHGLGMALLTHAFGKFYERGFRTVGLGVDTQNVSGATRLYERAGMRPKTRFDRVEKVLRPR